MKQYHLVWRLFSRILLSLAGFSVLTSANATAIGFAPGLTIQHTFGTGGTFATDYVDVGGYRFETFQGGKLAINTYTGEGRHYGGLWDGRAFGVASPLKITRLDGQAFSLENFSLLDHAGFACYQNFCGYDSIILQGYAPGSATAFGVNYPLDGYNNTYDFFSPVAQDARFSNVREAVIINNDSFILDTLTLSVPLPTSAWLLGSGLLAMFFKLRIRIRNHEGS